MNDPSNLNVLELMVQCQKQDRDNRTHEPFCFELFRRAIVDGDDASWSVIYKQYTPFVQGWVRQKLEYNDPDTEDVVQNAFLAFMRYYTPEKFDKAKHLGSILSFLKSCVGTEVLQLFRYRGRRGGEQSSKLDPLMVSPHDVAEEVEATINREKMWGCIDEECNDERDRIIARDLFEFGLKPSEIHERYPEFFDSSAAVSKVKRNLLKRLERSDCIKDVQK